MSKEKLGLPLALLSVLVGLEVKASWYSFCPGLHRQAGQSSACNRQTKVSFFSGKCALIANTVY